MTIWAWSVLSLWARGDWDNAIRAYFGLERYISPPMAATTPTMVPLETLTEPDKVRRFLDVLKRVCEQTKSPRLLLRPGRPNFDLNFYALRKDGVFGSAKITAGGRYAVNDGTKNELREQAYLFERA